LPRNSNYAAADQRHQHQQQCQIQSGEHRRVPAREGREHARAGHHQPYLVAVPERPDRVQRHAHPGFGPAHDRVQRADSEVKALEHEEADPQDRDHDEPDGVQLHQ
jgi:hypothetical protein